MAINNATKNRHYTYSDVHRGLEFDITGNIIEYYDYDVIDKAIRTYFGTVPGERMRSSYGSTLMSNLFKPMTQETANSIRRVITKDLEEDEPRISVSNVTVVPDYDAHTYTVDIVYIVLGLSGQYSTTFKLRSFS